MRRMREGLARREHHVGRTRDQVLGAEDAIHAGFRENVGLPIRELPGELAGGFLGIGQRRRDHPPADVRGDAIPVPAPGRRCGCQARRAGPRVPAIPPVERGPVHAELPQRAPCGQIRVFDEADDLAFLRCRQSHVSSPESDATRLF